MAQTRQDQRRPGSSLVCQRRPSQNRLPVGGNHNQAAVGICDRFDFSLMRSKVQTSLAETIDVAGATAASDQRLLRALRATWRLRRDPRVRHSRDRSRRSRSTPPSAPRSRQAPAPGDRAPSAHCPTGPGCDQSDHHVLQRPRRQSVRSDRHQVEQIERILHRAAKRAVVSR